MIRQWLVDHPTRQKTPRGMPRCINGWLKAEYRKLQATRRDGAYVEPAGARPKVDPAYLKAYQEHYFRLEKQLGNLEAAREAKRLTDKAWAER